MAKFHERWIKETFDGDGRLTAFRYTYEENFNYGYDVVDRLGEEYPERLAIIWENDRG